MAIGESKRLIEEGEKEFKERQKIISSRANKPYRRCRATNDCCFVGGTTWSLRKNNGRENLRIVVVVCLHEIVAKEIRGEKKKQSIQGS